jgi:hypothetical protein
MKNVKMPNRMRNAKCEMRNHSGFSLIELVFAMSFLTIIVFGVISLQSSNLAMMNRQNNQIQAHFHANQGIQIVKAFKYDDIGASCMGFSCDKKISKGATYKLDIGKEAPIPNTVFKRTIKIDNTGLANAYKIRSIIEWEDSTGPHTLADNSHVEAKIIISKD